MEVCEKKFNKYIEKEKMLQYYYYIINQKKNNKEIRNLRKTKTSVRVKKTTMLIND